MMMGTTTTTTVDDQQRHRQQQQRHRHHHHHHHQPQQQQRQRRVTILRSFRPPRRRSASTSIVLVVGLILVLISVVERQQQRPPTWTKYNADPVEVGESKSRGMSTSKTATTTTTTSNSSKRKSIEEEKQTVNQELLDLIRDASAATASGKGKGTISTKQQTKKPVVNVVWQLKDGNSFGFGTTTIWITIMKLFFDELFDLREFVIDQSRMDKYRYNSTHGLFSGFFEPDPNAMYHVVDDLNISNNKWPSSSGVYYYEQNDNSDDETATTTTLVTGQMNRWEYRELRKLAMQYYGPDKSRLKKLALYGKVSNEICHLLRLTKETQQYVEENIWKDSKDHWPTISNIISGSGGGGGGGEDDRVGSPRRSVAFHIRRGDKSIEIPLTKASTYVSKMMKVVDDPLHSVQDCFVATDSYHAAIELEHALQSQNMTCHLSSLVKPNYKTTRGKQDFLGFLAEYLILTKTTYFVGTFTSNVGDLVALTRRCEQQQQQQRKQQHGDKEDDDDEMKSVLTKYNHYSQSYGVDMDEWDMIEFYINHQKQAKPIK